MSINPCPTEQLYFPVLVHNVDILISCPCNKIMKKRYISMSIHIYMFWNVHIKGGGGSHKMCHLFRYLEVILLMIYNFFCQCCLFSIFFNSFIMSPPPPPHFCGETYCFCPVRLSVTQFFSATPLKLLNKIS